MERHIGIHIPNIVHRPCSLSRTTIRCSAKQYMVGFCIATASYFFYLLSPSNPRFLRMALHLDFQKSSKGLSACASFISITSSTTARARRRVSAIAGYCPQSALINLNVCSLPPLSFEDFVYFASKSSNIFRVSFILFRLCNQNAIRHTYNCFDIQIIETLFKECILALIRKFSLWWCNFLNCEDVFHIIQRIRFYRLSIGKELVLCASSLSQQLDIHSER